MSWYSFGTFPTKVVLIRIIIFSVFLEVLFILAFIIFNKHRVNNLNK